MDASRFAVWRLIRKWPSRGDSWCNHCSANMDSQGRGELVWSDVKLGRRAELQVRQYSPSVKNKLIVALNRHLGKICRVFSLNAHVMMCQLFHQEDNWGALCHWKDLWQEETVRIVTQHLASRAKQLNNYHRQRTRMIGEFIPSEFIPMIISGNFAYHLKTNSLT